MTDFPHPDMYVVVVGIEASTIASKNVTVMHNVVFHAKDSADATRQAIDSLTVREARTIVGARAMRVADMPPVPLTPEEAKA